MRYSVVGRGGFASARGGDGADDDGDEQDGHHMDGDDEDRSVPEVSVVLCVMCFDVAKCLFPNLLYPNFAASLILFHFRSHMCTYSSA